MILKKIIESTTERIQKQKTLVPLEALKEQVADMDTDMETGYPFEQALSQEGIGFICEVKKASPSKGVIAEDFPYVEIAKEYEKAGASAISVLTEPIFFQGSLEFLKEIRAQVNVPLLRKDFVIDEYMIYEAKAAGASAILLICSILTDEQLKTYRVLAERLGMSALVEVHDEEEVQRALAAGSRIIGANNRDLKTFQVNIQNSLGLRGLIPPKVLFVSESGIKGPKDIAALQENGTDAVLIGETLMRSKDKKKMLNFLRGTC